MVLLIKISGFSNIFVYMLALYSSVSLGIRSRKSDQFYLTADMKFIRLSYDEKFAYGCLYELQVPLNNTPDRTFSSHQEREVLIQIYHNTNGKSWFNKTGWLNETIPHCKWYGITCENKTGYIISIYLRQNNLTGILPQTLWKLRNLQGLCAGHNPGLIGTVRDVVSFNMTSLLRLDLAFNNHFGKIPGDVLVQMKSLQKIQLCCQEGNRLTGEIPKDIGNLKDLQVLSLGEIRLEGIIPKSIGRLRKLWFIDLEAPFNLTGGFENLFNISSIRFMHLSSARLKGNLPKNFGQLFPDMYECLLTGNDFTGPIPSTFGHMKKLTHLSLANNNFTGMIPKSIASLPYLRIADLSQNGLTSVENGTVFNSSPLEVLSLAANEKLHLKLGDFLQALYPVSSFLRFLNISYCHFHGDIPDSLWKFLNFIAVDMRKNQLTGRLPKPSQNMLLLFYLDLSFNDLAGTIPQEFAQLLALQNFDISGNKRMCSSDKAGALPNFITPDFSTMRHRNSNDTFKCPNARLTFNNGLVTLDPEYYYFSLCICDIGYYGQRGICFKCMDGGECHDKIPPARYMTIKRGYWPSPVSTKSTHLVRCSDTPYLGEETACNPTGKCDCWISPLRNASQTATPTSWVTVCRDACLCHKGNTDRICSRCEDNFFKQGSVCLPCPSNKYSIYLIVGLSIVTIVLLILSFVWYDTRRVLSVIISLSQIVLLVLLVFFHIIPPWLFELNFVVLLLGIAGRGNSARGLIKISIFYFQTLDALVASTNVWPAKVVLAHHYVSSVFNLRLAGFACFLPVLFTPMGELVSIMLLPLLIVLVTWSFFCLAWSYYKVRGHPNRVKAMQYSCLQLTIVSLNLTYFPIVNKTAAVLATCTKDDQQYFMRIAPWIECGSTRHSVLIAIAWVSFILGVIGIPFGIFLPLLKWAMKKRHNLEANGQEILDSWLGSIYLPYKVRFRSYFEIVFLLRRMLIAFSLALIPSSSSFQTTAVCWVLLAAISFHFFFRPFICSLAAIPLENVSEAVVLLVLHYSFISVRFIMLSPSTGTPILWILLIVNCFVITFLVIALVVVLVKASRRENHGTVDVLPATASNAPTIATRQTTQDDEKACSPPLSIPKERASLFKRQSKSKYGTFQSKSQCDSY